ncbi:hypothetical protein C8F01DRAFT_173877 [Mycena amicta]|nr:hypothetical protein C8F01DRAFT_173877 [Mycena amicta]
MSRAAFMRRHEAIQATEAPDVTRRRTVRAEGKETRVASLTHITKRPPSGTGRCRAEAVRPLCHLRHYTISRRRRRLAGRCLLPTLLVPSPNKNPPRCWFGEGITPAVVCRRGSGAVGMGGATNWRRGRRRDDNQPNRSQVIVTLPVTHISALSYNERLPSGRSSTPAFSDTWRFSTSCLPSSSPSPSSGFQAPARPPRPLNDVCKRNHARIASRTRISTTRSLYHDVCRTFQREDLARDGNRPTLSLSIHPPTHPLLPRSSLFRRSRSGHGDHHLCLRRYDCFRVRAYACGSARGVASSIRPLPSDNAATKHTGTGITLAPAPVPKLRAGTVSMPSLASASASFVSESMPASGRSASKPERLVSHWRCSSPSVESRVEVAVHRRGCGLLVLDRGKCDVVVDKRNGRVPSTLTFRCLLGGPVEGWERGANREALWFRGYLGRQCLIPLPVFGQCS